MSIDFSTAAHVRQYREEQGTYRGLPLLAKGVASYLKNLVDAVHGWLHLDGNTITVAVLNHASGEVSRSHRSTLTWCLKKLLQEGHLIRCEVRSADLGTFVASDERPIILSPWVENLEGDWIVVKNWVPAQNGLTPEDQSAWHAARQQRIAAASGSGSRATTSAHAEPVLTSSEGNHGAD